MPKVLIVEDEWLIAEYFRIVVEQLGYEVCGTAGTAEEAVRLARQQDPAIVLMDVRLSGPRDGLDAAREICKTKIVPMVFVTASRGQQTSRRIDDDHPAEILIKPVRAADLKAALDRFCPLPQTRQ